MLSFDTVTDKCFIVFTIPAKKYFTEQIVSVESLKSTLDAGFVSEGVFIIGTEKDELACLIVIVPLKGIQTPVHGIDVITGHDFPCAFPGDQTAGHSDADIYLLSGMDLFQTVQSRQRQSLYGNIRSRQRRGMHGRGIKIIDAGDKCIHRDRVATELQFI